MFHQHLQMFTNRFTLVANGTVQGLCLLVLTVKVDHVSQTCSSNSHAPENKINTSNFTCWTSWQPCWLNISHTGKEYCLAQCENVHGQFQVLPRSH